VVLSAPSAQGDARLAMSVLQLAQRQLLRHEGSQLLLQLELLAHLDLRRPYLQPGSLNVAVSKALAGEVRLHSGRAGGRRGGGAAPRCTERPRPLRVAEGGNVGQLAVLALRQLQQQGCAVLEFAPAAAGGSALLVAAGAQRQLQLQQEGRDGRLRMMLQEGRQTRPQARTPWSCVCRLVLVVVRPDDQLGLCITSAPSVD
jgi:hypothetical protein